MERSGRRRMGQGGTVLGGTVGPWSAIAVAFIAVAMTRPASAQTIMSSISPRTERTATVTGALAWPTEPGCNRHPAPTDTIEVLITATLESPPGRARLPQGYALDVVEAATSTFRLPPVIAVAVFAPDTIAVPVVSGAATFSVDSAGGVRDVRLDGPSTASGLDTALLGAIAHAAAAHRFPPFPRQLHQSSVDVTVAISSVQWKQAGDTIPARVPLFSVALPRYKTLTRATGLQLPDALALSTLTEPVASGEHGPVLLEYVVDVHGLPVGATIRVVEAHTPLAGQQAENLFAQAVLNPAVAGRCPVPQLMRLPVAVR